MNVKQELRAHGSEVSEVEGVCFAFEGERLVGRRGESVAAALTAAGIRLLRTTRNDAPRGIFCGMGVCGECLVEIDGVANQRACMTKLERPVSIRRQRHLARAAASAEVEGPEASPAMPLEPDVLVVGGGAGGLNAARHAALAGAKVVLVDDRPFAGGQYYKQPLPIRALAEAHASDRQFADGRALVEATERAGVTMLRGARAWGAFEPLEVLIAAQQSLRGACGHHGAEIAAVVELSRRPSMRDLPAIAAMLASTPALALRGAGYLAELMRRGIPVLYGSVLADVTVDRGALSALVKRWPSEPQGVGRRFEIDAVAMGYGFMPSNEILRALGCAHRFDPGRGHLVTERDADQRTNVPEIYAVGDCTGLGGAPAAEAEGIVAGLAAAKALGLGLNATLLAAEARARSSLARHRRFQAGLWQLYRAPRLAADLATAETAICRCEELTHGVIETESKPGPLSIGALKRGTRSGMGRCQGRYCGPILAQLSADRERRNLDETGHWAPRPPTMPIAIAHIVREDPQMPDFRSFNRRIASDRRS